MDNYNSINNLKDFKDKILIAEASEADIVKFIEFVSSTEMFNDTEKKLTIFEIWYLLTMTDHSALVNALLPTIPAKIIFTESNLIKEKENNNIAAAHECKNCDDMDDLAKRLIAKWSPFDAEHYPNLKRPEPGATGNVFFDDTDIIPGKIITANARIDHMGNILDFLSGPTEVITCNDYEEIYAGLVGQIFDVEGLNAK